MSVDCVVCDDKNQGTNKNPIFVCEDCGIGVHKLCYGITATPENADPWWCSPCTLGRNEAVCVLCLQNGGALKKTVCGNWVHVICALFIEGVKFTNNTLMEPVSIANIPQENYGKKCVFCLDVRGVSCKCSGPNCDQFLHITCGQKNNCLKELPNPKNKKKLLFEAYCRQHKPREFSRRISSVFVMERLAAKDDQHQHDIIATIDISSDTTNNNDDSKNRSSGASADHFVNGDTTKNDDIEVSHPLNIGNQSANTNDNISNRVTDFGHMSSIYGASFANDTDINSNITNVCSNTSNSDENDGIKDDFWWDYLELQKRENELEAQLHSKDLEIDTVIINNYFIISKKHELNLLNLFV